jgi:hypothetical protein
MFSFCRSFVVPGMAIRTFNPCSVVRAVEVALPLMILRLNGSTVEMVVVVVAAFSFRLRETSRSTAALSQMGAMAQLLPVTTHREEGLDPAVRFGCKPTASPLTAT